MLNCFKLELGTANPFSTYEADGRKILEKTWPASSRSLDDFIATGVLDGDAIKEKWFRKTNAHVFISHAHADENKALGLAGFLWEELGLLPFVDSLIWGDNRKLQRRIDEKYCWQDDSNEVFDYDKRNYSTSHVHMMLATSLSAAMDSCECLIFLDTPKSISIEDADAPDLGKVATESPWIYHELMTSSLLQRKPDGRRRQIRMAAESHGAVASDSADQPLRVGYRVPKKHLLPLSTATLLECAGKGFQEFPALDWLYANAVTGDSEPFVLLESILKEIQRKS